MSARVVLSIQRLGEACAFRGLGMIWTLCGRGGARRMRGGHPRTCCFRRRDGCLVLVALQVFSFSALGFFLNL